MGRIFSCSTLNLSIPSNFFHYKWAGFLVCNLSISLKNTLYVYTERVITNSVRNKINLKKFHSGRDVWTASRGIKNSSHVVFWFLNFSRGLTSSDDEGEGATRDFSLLSHNLFFSKLYSGVENSWKDIRWSKWGWREYELYTNLAFTFRSILKLAIY